MFNKYRKMTTVLASDQVIITTPEVLRREFRSVINEYLDKQKEDKGSKLLTINQVRKKLGLAHATVSKKVRNGLIKTTPDGLITQAAVDEYLKNAK